MLKCSANSCRALATCCGFRRRRNSTACWRSRECCGSGVKKASRGTSSERAICRRTSTEAFPDPVSSCARNRSDTPESAARAFLVKPRFARADRRFFPSSSRYSESLRVSVPWPSKSEEWNPFWEVAAIDYAGRKSTSTSRNIRFCVSQNLASASSTFQPEDEGKILTSSKG